MAIEAEDKGTEVSFFLRALVCQRWGYIGWSSFPGLEKPFSYLVGGSFKYRQVKAPVTQGREKGLWPCFWNCAVTLDLKEVWACMATWTHCLGRPRQQ